jgi:hypothetical protein
MYLCSRLYYFYNSCNIVLYIDTVAAMYGGMYSTYQFMQSYFAASEDGNGQDETNPSEEIYIPQDQQQSSIKQPNTSVQSDDKSPSSQTSQQKKPIIVDRKRKSKKKKETLTNSDFLKLANLLLF